MDLASPVIFPLLLLQPCAPLAQDRVVRQRRELHRTDEASSALRERIRHQCKRKAGLWVCPHKFATHLQMFDTLSIVRPR